MDIITIPVAQIRVAAYNPRKDLQPGDAEYQAISRSLKDYGLIEPLIWNQRTGNLVGGHQRFKILTAEGATELPVSVVDLDPGQEKALNLALNRVQGAWDGEKLVDLLEGLMASGQDIAVTGFTEKDIEAILGQFEPIDLDEMEETQGEAGQERAEHRCPKCGFEF